ncbi:MAG: hypothetical protein KGI72_04445 [Patescibacteria group bacterium]|nr:hypothetical protein [Patescibacteria group bacterium]
MKEQNLSRATLIFRSYDEKDPRRITVYVRRADNVIELQRTSDFRAELLRERRKDGYRFPKYVREAPFFKWFLYQPYAVEPTLIDQIESFFTSDKHAFRPVQVRLNYRYLDRAERRVRAVCTIYNARGSNEYTVRIESRGEFKSLRDTMAFFVRDDSVRGYSVAGNIKALVWFLSQNFDVTSAGGFRESCTDYRNGAADWNIPCSDFYLVRAGQVDDKPRKISPEMKEYVEDPKRFRLSEEIRSFVIQNCSIPHLLNGRNEFITVRRLFTKEDRLQTVI